MFVEIWNILWNFGIFCGNLVCFTEKNLSTLVTTQVDVETMPTDFKILTRYADVWYVPM
jgi:hypothetical protein